MHTLAQACAAWRTKGSGLAQPLILAAMVRMRSVAEAPTSATRLETRSSAGLGVVEVQQLVAHQLPSLRSSASLELTSCTSSSCCNNFRCTPDRTASEGSFGSSHTRKHACGQIEANQNPGDFGPLFKLIGFRFRPRYMFKGHVMSEESTCFPWIPALRMRRGEINPK